MLILLRLSMYVLLVLNGLKKQLKVLICSIIVFHKGVGGSPDLKILSSMWLRPLFTFRKFVLHYIRTHKYIPKHRYYFQSLPTSIHIDTVSFRSSVFFFYKLYTKQLLFFKENQDSGPDKFRHRHAKEDCFFELVLWGEKL